MLIQLMMNLMRCLIMLFKMMNKINKNKILSKIVINNQYNIHKMIINNKMNNKVIFNNKKIKKIIIKKYNNKLKHSKINRIKIIILICNANQCIKYQNK